MSDTALVKCVGLRFLITGMWVLCQFLPKLGWDGNSQGCARCCAQPCSLICKRALWEGLISAPILDGEAEAQKA